MRSLAAAASAALALAAAPPAQADHCAVLPRVAGGEPGVYVALGTEAARYQTERYEGHWMGVVPEAAATWRGTTLRAALPLYRVSRNGLDGEGVGDLRLDLRTIVLRGPRAIAGAGLGASAPTGDTRLELGMGHLMLMPHLYGHAQHGRWFAGALLSYGQALGAGGGHHRTSGAIVDQMNTSEVAGSAALGVALGAAFRLSTALSAAAPLTSGGRARLVATGAAVATFGRWDVTVAGHGPLYGDPFTARVSAGIGARL